MRNDKKDIRKVRLNNLIFGTSTITTACLYYGLRLGNIIYHSEQEIGLFEAMASSVETIFTQPLKKVSDSMTRNFVLTQR